MGSVEPKGRCCCWLGSGKLAISCKYKAKLGLFHWFKNLSSNDGPQLSVILNGDFFDRVAFRVTYQRLSHVLCKCNTNVFKWTTTLLLQALDSPAKADRTDLCYRKTWLILENRWPYFPKISRRFVSSTTPLHVPAETDTVQHGIDRNVSPHLYNA